MGEIGITTGQFYYGLRWWEIKAIIRGYNRRNRAMWSATRWQTYNIMVSFSGGQSLSEKGIHGPKDLLPLPWDTDDFDTANLPTEDEIKEMQADIAAWNAQLQKADQQ